MTTIQLEEIILSVLIDYPGKLLSAEQILRPQCFTDDRKYVYEAIIALTEKEIPVDKITVQEELRRNEDHPIDVNYSSMDQTCILSGNFETYIRMLYEKWLAKELSKLSKMINAEIERNSDPFEIMEAVSSNIDLLENNIQANETTMMQDLPKLFSDTEKRMTGAEPAGLMSSTFPSFNKATGGIMTSDYVVIYGDYKAGKSTVAEQLALDIAFNKKSIGIFNLEMTKETLYQKALSMRTGIDYLKLRNPKGHGLTRPEFEDMKAAAWDLFNGTKIFVEDKVFDIEKIIIRMKAWKKKHGIDLFLVDYLGLLESEKRYTARHLEMASYSRRLKNLAKQLNTPIIVLSQANAENKTAESKGPARDADFVISVCKPTEAGINSIKDKNGQNFNFTQDHFLVTMENSRHGRNRQNFVCEFQNNNFIEITLEYSSFPSNSADYHNRSNGID